MSNSDSQSHNSSHRKEESESESEASEKDIQSNSISSFFSLSHLKLTSFPLWASQWTNLRPKVKPSELKCMIREAKGGREYIITFRLRFFVAQNKIKLKLGFKLGVKFEMKVKVKVKLKPKEIGSFLPTQIPTAGCPLFGPQSNSYPFPPPIPFGQTKTWGFFLFYLTLTLVNLKNASLNVPCGVDRGFFGVKGRKKRGKKGWPFGFILVLFSVLDFIWLNLTRFFFFFKFCDVSYLNRQVGVSLKFRSIQDTNLILWKWILVECLSKRFDKKKFI